MRESHKRLFFGCFFATFILSFTHLVHAAVAPSKEKITVLTKKDVGRVNSLVFGVNLLGYDPATYEKHAAPDARFADFGGGIWNPEQNQPVQAEMEHLKEAGISAVRFPGGCGTHHYDWKTAVGKNRAHFRFGIDEFLKVANEIGAEPIITLSYFAADEHDNADLIEYLNAPADGRNPNGGTDWAVERAKNGHPEPYHVSYVEIGNEVWHGDHRGIKRVSPEAYAQTYLEHFQAIRAVDPQVKVGVLLHDDDWDRTVLEIVKDRFDFGVMHFYFSAGRAGKNLSNEDPKRIFTETVNEPRHYRKAILRKLERLRKAAGRGRPIALTEFNTAFTRDEPVPYRHALGAALVNAEVLKVLLSLKANILMANYWDFPSRFWGIIKPPPEYAFFPLGRSEMRGTDSLKLSGQGLSEEGKRAKRPNFYVYKLYHDHFGERLIETVQHRQSPLSINAAKSVSGKKVYLIVVNKNMNEFAGASIELKDFSPAATGEAWVLNGPSVEATNETDPDNVGITRETFDLSGNTFTFHFAPHSLTAIEIESE